VDHHDRACTARDKLAEQKKEEQSIPTPSSCDLKEEGMVKCLRKSKQLSSFELVVHGLLLEEQSHPLGDPNHHLQLNHQKLINARHCGRMLLRTPMRFL